MRILAVVLSLAAVIAVSPARAANTADPAIMLGLQTCMSNGVDNGVRAWYPDSPQLAAKMAAKVTGETANLGPIIDTEVVAIQAISKRVTRYYVALYFRRSPLWIKIDRYQSQEKSFLMPLKCSTDPDAILPGYVTQFLASP